MLDFGILGERPWGRCLHSISPQDRRSFTIQPPSSVGHRMILVFFFFEDIINGMRVWCLGRTYSLTDESFVAVQRTSRATDVEEILAVYRTSATFTCLHRSTARV